MKVQVLDDDGKVVAQFDCAAPGDFDPANSWNDLNKLRESLTETDKGAGHE